MSEILSDLLKLPIGIQNFEEIRAEGYRYVDKTRYLVRLIDSGKAYFLSRPRRFGKSLTLSTFDALFSGKRDLFQGLYAQKFLDRPEFVPSPVVRFDMSRTTTNRDVEALEYSMLRQVAENAERHGVEVSDPYPGDALSSLLQRTAEKHGRIVVLVDEYDKPILDCLEDPEKAEVFRTTLRNFYTQIKAEDANTRFVFVTGITKFTKTGVFSAMNNLKDISMKDDYAAMLGYTEDEMIRDFAPHITRAAGKLVLTEQELLERMKSYYDGFSFDGATRLYNPFSTLNFFDDIKFDNYWFDSGSPSFLVDYVKTHDLNMEDFRGLRVRSNFADVREIELATPESFLFQSGYLTVRERFDSSLILDYPNLEVLASFSQLCMDSVYVEPNEKSAVDAISLDLEEEFATRGADALIEAYGRILAKIPYDLYEREERRQGEAFYHALLLVLLWASKIPTRAENHSYRGRSDVEIEYRGRAYVIELQVAEGKDACERAADEALEQIKTKGYADKYPSATLIGIVIDKTTRRIEAFRITSAR